jgi:hypothetical protein
MKSNPVTNFLAKIKKSLSRKGKGKGKTTSRRRRTNKKGKKQQPQKGGVGFSPDVSACRIGGRPEIVPTSDCPPGVGPGSKDFAKAVYGLKGGSRRRRSNRRRTRTNRRKPGCSGKK